MPRWPQVSPGDPLAIPAPTFNAMVDAARAHHARKQLPGMVDPRTAPNDYVVRIKNSSGEDVPRYGILAIDGLVITPDDNDAILDDPLLDGTNTTSTDDKVAIVLQPLADGEIGTAVVGGVVACTINVTDTSHDYAEPSTEAAATGVTRLESSSSGYMRILWKDSGTGEKDALITFPHTPPASLQTYTASFVLTGSGSSRSDTINVGTTTENDVFVAHYRYVATRGYSDGTQDVDEMIDLSGAIVFTRTANTAEYTVNGQGTLLFQQHKATDIAWSIDSAHAAVTDGDEIFTTLGGGDTGQIQTNAYGDAINLQIEIENDGSITLGWVTTNTYSSAQHLAVTMTGPRSLSA